MNCTLHSKLPHRCIHATVLQDDFKGQETRDRTRVFFKKGFQLNFTNRRMPGWIVALKWNWLRPFSVMSCVRECVSTESKPAMRNNWQCHLNVARSFWMNAYTHTCTSSKPTEQIRQNEKGTNCPIHWVAFAQMNFQKDVLIELVNGRRANRKFISKCVRFRMSQKGSHRQCAHCSLKAIATPQSELTRSYCM